MHIVVCGLQEAGNIVALAVDDVQRLIFWANNAREWRAIYRAETSGSSLTTIITTGALSFHVTVLMARPHCSTYQLISAVATGYQEIRICLQRLTD